MTKILKLHGYWLWCAIWYGITELVQLVLPHYIAYVMRYARHARSIVYMYWLKYDTPRFFNFLSKHSGTPNVATITDYQGLLTFRCTIRGSEVIRDYYLGPMSIWHTYSRYHKYILNIRYWWYYVMVWMWLDDENNINGVDRRIIAPQSTRAGREFMALPAAVKSEKILRVKIYRSVFEYDYHTDPTSTTLLEYHRRLWFVKYIHLNNLCRDKFINNNYFNEHIILPGCGFLVGKVIKRGSLCIFGYHVVEKGL